jgi:hypothetical protein
VGEGACRGLTSMWLGAHKTGVNYVASFRKCAHDDIKSLIIQGNTQQKNIGECRKRLLTAEETLRAAIEKAQQARQRPRAQAEVERLVEEVSKEQKNAELAVDLVSALALGTLQAIGCTRKSVIFLMLKALLFETLGPGLHYVSLQNHALGFFLQDVDSPAAFFDANSGEFCFSKGYDLELFFNDYMAKIYGEEYGFTHECNITTTTGNKITLDLLSYS